MAQRKFETAENCEHQCGEMSKNKFKYEKKGVDDKWKEILK